MHLKEKESLPPERRMDGGRKGGSEVLGLRAGHPKYDSMAK